MGRIIAQNDVEDELAARNCTKIRDYTFKTGSLWVTADQTYYFAVPQEISGWTEEDELQKLLQFLDSR